MKKRIPSSKVVSLGKKISGGWGYWGHEVRKENALRRKAVDKAFINTLREIGYDDIDIIFYGDWKDGRHIGDALMGADTYTQMKGAIKHNAEKSPSMVKKVNKESYGKEYDDLEI